MTERAHLRPRAGFKVPHPARGRGVYLPAEGEVVTLDAYWRRRLADGDVERVAKPSKTKKES